MEVYDDMVGGMTPQNAHLKPQLEKLEQGYRERGLHNGTLFTFKGMGTGTLFDHLSAREQEHFNLGGHWPYILRPFDPVLSLVLGQCRYYEQVAMVEGAIEEMNPTHAILVSACTVTEDGYLVLARRRGSAEGKLGIIGGTLNGDELSLGQGLYANPDVAMRNESTSELGVDQDEAIVRLRAVLSDNVVTPVGNFPRPVFFYDVTLAMGRYQLTRRFAASDQAQAEHSELIFIPNTIGGILEFMRSHSPEELHSPANSVLAVALERATGVQVI